ncbi:hypothetical protein MTBLM5_150065 [Magnetospirillum sp. LM-5]|nr:hypothetical protein MTBLM5_150065 [Magnetospirillum sp. LM-5]
MRRSPRRLDRRPLPRLCQIDGTGGAFHPDHSVQHQHIKRIVQRPAPEFGAAHADAGDRGHHLERTLGQFGHRAGGDQKGTLVDREARSAGSGGAVEQELVDDHLGLLAQGQHGAIDEANLEPGAGSGAQDRAGRDGGALGQSQGAGLGHTLQAGDCSHRGRLGEIRQEKKDHKDQGEEAGHETLLRLGFPLGVVARRPLSRFTIIGAPGLWSGLTAPRETVMMAATGTGGPDSACPRWE